MKIKDLLEHGAYRVLTKKKNLLRRQMQNVELARVATQFRIRFQVQQQPDHGSVLATDSHH